RHAVVNDLRLCPASSTFFPYTPLFRSSTADASEAAVKVGPPLWLLCELTYRCPLHCVFCYNPLDMHATGPELATDDWLRVLREADRKSTRLNSSHVEISYAVFCLKKKI